MRQRPLQVLFLAGLVLAVVGGGLHWYWAQAEANMSVDEWNTRGVNQLRLERGNELTMHFLIIQALGTTTGNGPGLDGDEPLFLVTDGKGVETLGLPGDGPVTPGDWYKLTLEWMPDQQAWVRYDVERGVQPSWLIGLYAAGAGLATLVGGIALVLPPEAPRAQGPVSAERDAVPADGPVEERERPEDVPPEAWDRRDEPDDRA